MTNIEKLNEIFCEVFNVESTALSDNLTRIALTAGIVSTNSV